MESSGNTGSLSSPVSVIARKLRQVDSFSGSEFLGPMEPTDIVVEHHLGIKYR